MIHSALLADLRNPGAKLFVLRSSGWIPTETPPSELERLYADFGSEFDTAQSAITALLGPPTHSHSTHPEWLESWYPEAIRFAAWPAVDGLLTLGLEHQDREVPIVLCLSHVSAVELSARQGSQ